MGYLYTTASTSANITWTPYVYNGSTALAGVPFAPAAAPAELAPLEWLDREIEATCALARRAA